MYNPRPLIEHVESLQDEISREIKHHMAPPGMEVPCHSPWHWVSITALHDLRRWCRNAIDDNELIGLHQ